MYLKTLQLRGFKSFASATTLEFEPGITCVVGPNGSGKSNVVDALAWVMGEQGVKTLRGGKMEDVIFAGTSTRGALGRAEVSLTIDNSDGALDIDYTEVTLTRTLFRNGGSEYAINGAQCRLLDIQDLLSDTGLGREMHVIVGQGQLDAVLRATPLDRRGFIEEAAGVLKHRKRKEKALRKLAGMQGNLLRLADLLSELNRQLGPLARQAKAAQRAQVLAATVRDSGMRLLADDLNTAQDQVRNHRESTKHRKELLQTSETELAAIRSTLAQREHAAALASPQSAAAGQTVASLLGQREQLRNLQTLATERLRHLGSAPVDDAIDLTQIRQQLERVKAQAETAKQQVTQARQTADESSLTKQVREQELRVAQLELTNYDKQTAAHRERIAQLTSQASAQRSRVETLTAEIDRLGVELRAAHERLELARTAATPDEPENQVLDAQLEASSQHLVELRSASKAAQAELSETQQETARAQARMAAARAKAQALELSLQHGHGDSAVLTEVDGVVGQVLGQFDAPDSLQVALESALAHLGSAVITSELTKAIEISRSEQAQDLGTATVLFPGKSAPRLEPELVTRALEALGDQQAGRLVEQVELASDLPWLAQLLEELLQDVIVVSTMQMATTLVTKEPRLTAVTMAGHVLSDGLVRLWTPLEAGPLRLRSELADAVEAQRELSAELETLELKSQAQGERVKECTAVLLDAQTEHEVLVGQTQERSREHARAAAVLENARQEVARTHTTIDQAQQRLAQAQQTLVQTADQLGAADQDFTPDQGRQDNLRQQILVLETGLEAARNAETEARVALRGLQEQFAGQTQRVSSTERTLHSQEQAVERAQQANRVRKRRAERAQSVLDQAEIALGLLEQSIQGALEARDRAQQLQQERDQEIMQLRERAEHLHQTVRANVDIVHGDELRLTVLEQQVEQYANKSIELYATDPAELVAGYGPHVPIVEPAGPQTAAAEDSDSGAEPQGDEQTVLLGYNRQEQEEIYARSKRKLATLGKINPLALEEFTALQERQEFLAAQLEDLRASRADLMSLVTDIDNRVEQAFSQAYADTAAQFTKVFARLFPGGHGQLTLDDPENPLTSGIDIEAKPAGKKVKRLSLLSGGERSLTAIAFLVAIFLARPSPFYVMDEVEAALDDVNLGRLLAVFEELRQNSQLIVISHQKRTMQISDALYGVTMAGDGISTVISQRLEPRNLEGTEPVGEVAV
ncbi:chromosome segregation protein SMC [Jonesiaceae bacterium BS-20]|uniref:Chromosome partition protein Smc n=1 Tax=Jonesiaceae bacterium BS-20 TaxID=3120821 RepID=A0AAU7DZ37_9MICO